MKTNDDFHEFPAIKGIQAGRPYYVIMCPLNIVPRLFSYNDNSLPPNMRAQRVLNKGRIPEMKRYILDNKDSYVFSALTASVDGDMVFHSETDSALGMLKISMRSRIIINDGQHRRAAIEAALQEHPDLRYEDISIVLYHDLGLKNTQQVFSDLNRYAIRPTKSLNILYDNRDRNSILIKQCISNIPLFQNSVEQEKSTISNRSSALFTLSGIYHASLMLINGLELTESEKKTFIIDFWKNVTYNMVLWNKVKNREITPVVFRKEYICAHAIALKAIGEVGNTLAQKFELDRKFLIELSFLKNIDWKKTNPDFNGCIIVNGRIAASVSNQKSLTSYLLDKYENR